MEIKRLGIVWFFVYHGDYDDDDDDDDDDNHSVVGQCGVTPMFTFYED